MWGNKIIKKYNNTYFLMFAKIEINRHSAIIIITILPFSQQNTMYAKYLNNEIAKIVGIYLMWIALHYVASHLYVRLCVPLTWLGFILSPFTAVSPHCQGLRWVLYNAGLTISNMWLVFGTWIVSHVFTNLKVD
jgi:hypothetical protein